jgi:hypothetical protein
MMMMALKRFDRPLRTEVEARDVLIESVSIVVDKESTRNLQVGYIAVLQPALHTMNATKFKLLHEICPVPTCVKRTLTSDNVSNPSRTSESKRKGEKPQFMSFFLCELSKMDFQNKHLNHLICRNFVTNSHVSVTTE